MRQIARIGLLLAVPAGCAGAQIPGIPRAPSTATFGVYDVRQFGAAGDGVTDDTAALQATLSAAAEGGVVHLPLGTYLVSSAAANGAILTIPGPNVRIAGAGIGQAVIKVKSGSLPYYSVLRGTKLGTDLSGLEIEHLTFDHNVAGNPISSSPELLTAPRCTIFVGAGSRISIHDVEVANASAVNDIVLNGTAVSRVYVGHCWWTNTGDDPNHMAHDASGIYVHADGALIEDNHFQSAGPNSPGATTAIETHGSHHVIRGNVIRDYGCGMNVTGIDQQDSTGLVVQGNVISGAVIGVHLWSSKYGTHASGYGIDGAIIESNIVRLAQTGTWSILAPSYVGGIVLDPTADLDVRGLKIRGNVVESPVENTPIAANHASLGIGWYSNADRVLRDSDITDNTIVGFPMAGVRLSCGVDNVQVRGNVLRDVGSTLDAAVPIAYRTPIFVAAPTLSGLRIEGNTITDSHAVTRNVYGMLLQAAASKYCSLLDNEVRLMGGDQSAFLAHIHLADDVVRPYLRGVFAGFKYDDAGAGRQFAPGSQVTDPRNGRVYRLAADNRTWSHE